MKFIRKFFRLPPEIPLEIPKEFPVSFGFPPLFSQEFYQSFFVKSSRVLSSNTPVENFTRVFFRIFVRSSFRVPPGINFFQKFFRSSSSNFLKVHPEIYWEVLQSSYINSSGVLPANPLDLIQQFWGSSFGAPSGIPSNSPFPGISPEFLKQLSTRTPPQLF